MSDRHNLRVNTQIVLIHEEIADRLGDGPIPICTVSPSRINVEANSPITSSVPVLRLAAVASRGESFTFLQLSSRSRNMNPVVTMSANEGWIHFCNKEFRRFGNIFVVPKRVAKAASILSRLAVKRHRKRCPAPRYSCDPLRAVSVLRIIQSDEIHVPTIHARPTASANIIYDTVERLVILRLIPEG
jgi:hypothetical protein